MDSEINADLWRYDPERWVQYRTKWLHRRLDVAEKVAEAVAWSEIGCSTSGIAKRTDHTAETVDAYLDQAADRFGADAALAQPASDLAIDRRFD